MRNIIKVMLVTLIVAGAGLFVGCEKEEGPTVPEEYQEEYQQQQETYQQEEDEKEDQQFQLPQSQ